MFRIVKHVLRILLYWCVDDQPPMEGLIYFKFFKILDEKPVYAVVNTCNAQNVNGLWV